MIRVRVENVQRVIDIFEPNHLWKMHWPVYLVQLKTTFKPAHTLIHVYALWEAVALTSDLNASMDEKETDIIQVKRNVSEAAHWKLIQKNTFTRWANEQLKQVGGQIVDLERDLSDGLLLTALLEVLSKKKLGTKEILRQRKLETVTKALRFLEVNEKVQLVNIGKLDFICLYCFPITFMWV